MAESGDRQTRFKILLADDEAPLRMLVSATLESSRYQLLEAANGKEALEMARREKPHLVLLDVAMPEMNGFEVCRQLKASPETSSITVIMLTAMGQQADRLMGQKVGADDYIVKPFSPSALLSKVDQVLGRKS